MKSTDPDVIKNARAVVKGKITSAVNSINALFKDTDGIFDHSKINRTNALTTHSKMVANLELIKGLHEDEEYVTEVELKAHKALDVHAEYE